MNGNTRPENISVDGDPTASPYWNPSSDELVRMCVRVSGPSEAKFYCQKHLVLSYLCHHCYVSTAKVLAQSQSMDTALSAGAVTTSRPPSPELHADDDHIMEAGDTSDMIVDGMVLTEADDASVTVEGPTADTVSVELDEETLRNATLRARQSSFHPQRCLLN